jgi:hypothetical protein
LEDDEQALIKKELITLLDIIIRADELSLIPPFLELDCNDWNTPDLSADFGIDDIDSFAMLKKDFSHISPRRQDGSIWCSIILAQSTHFSTFK